MHGPCVDDNDGPEAILLPAIALGVEVELVAARLGIVIRVSDAAVAAHAAQCPGWQFNNTFLCSSFSLKTYLSFGLRFPTQIKSSKIDSLDMSQKVAVLMVF